MINFLPSPKVSFIFKCVAFCCLWAMWPSDTYAQKRKKQRVQTEQSPRQTLVYANKNYLPQIRTVQFYPVNQEGALPIYTLGSTDQLLLSFDDLRGDVRTYFYSIEHCDANWEPSRLNALDYATGYNEDRIDNYTVSQGTIQLYTHYELRFPNEYIAPKVAGNYLLKIYEDADKNRLIITKRFYVIRPLIQVESSITPSLQASKRLSNQKLNVTIRTSALTINNPHRDIQIHVFQNQREDNKMVLTAPMFIGNNEIKYNSSETLDFLGNNEFRYADLRSTRSASGQVQELTLDTTIYAKLFTDEDNSSLAYATTYDENGRFYIRNLDNSNTQTQSDYAHVRFTLHTKQEIKGKIFVVGGFNDFQRNPENQLLFNEQTGLWEANIKLKQGLYDYEYVLEDTDGKVITDAFSNTFYSTGNDYLILVYHRRTGTYWDEILGIGYVSIHNKINKNR